MERKQMKLDKMNEVPCGPKEKHQRKIGKESSVKSRGKNSERGGGMGWDGKRKGAKQRAWRVCRDARQISSERVVSYQGCHRMN